MDKENIVGSVITTDLKTFLKKNHGNLSTLEGKIFLSESVGEMYQVKEVIREPRRKYSLRLTFDKNAPQLKEGGFERITSLESCLRDTLGYEITSLYGTIIEKVYFRYVVRQGVINPGITRNEYF